MSEEKVSEEPLPETIDYEKEFNNLLKTVGSLGVQLSLLRENTENRIAQVLEKQKKGN